MIDGIIISLKKAFSSLWLLVIMVFGVAPTSICEGRTILTNTKGVLESNRNKYYQYVKDIHSDVKMLKTFGWMPFTGWLASKIKNTSPQELKNAGIVWRFFDSGRSMQFVRAIGTSDDIAYIASVFTEFYNGSDRSFDRLITIMHHRMMDALGLPQTTSVDRFLAITEQKNKKGQYVNIRGQQFDTYCHMIALNLFISYCYQKNVGM